MKVTFSVAINIAHLTDVQAPAFVSVVHVDGDEYRAEGNDPASAIQHVSEIARDALSRYWQQDR